MQVELYPRCQLLITPVFSYFPGVEIDLHGCCLSCARRALLAARDASASIASASALHAWTSGSGIAHLHMACLHNRLYASHCACLEPDLDAARVEGGCCQNVLHDATGQSPGPLVVLLRDVHPEPWLDVFAVLTVHACASFPLSRWWRCRLLLHAHFLGHPCRHMLRRHRDEHTRLRFPARHSVVHPVSSLSSAWPPCSCAAPS